MVDVSTVKVFLANCVVDYNCPGFIPTLVKLIREWDASGRGELVFNPAFRSLLHSAQKDCVEEARKVDCTHILFMEDDTTKVPEHALEDLIGYDKDVIGAYAYSRHFPYYPMIMNKRVEDKDKCWDDGLFPSFVKPHQGVMQVEFLPFQFTLFKMEVFKLVEEPWFEYGKRGGTDGPMSDKCNRLGVEMWCDTNMIVQHNGLDGKTVGFKVWQAQMLQTVPDDSAWYPGMIKPLLQIPGMKWQDS